MVAALEKTRHIDFWLKQRRISQGMYFRKPNWVLFQGPFQASLTVIRSKARDKPNSVDVSKSLPLKRVLVLVCCMVFFFFPSLYFVLRQKSHCVLVTGVTSWVGWPIPCSHLLASVFPSAGTAAVHLCAWMMQVLQVEARVLRMLRKHSANSTTSQPLKDDI